MSPSSRLSDKSLKNKETILYLLLSDANHHTLHLNENNIKLTEVQVRCSFQSRLGFDRLVCFLEGLCSIKNSVSK